jgi:hypothetical protein
VIYQETWGYMQVQPTPDACRQPIELLTAMYKTVGHFFP